MKDPAVLLYINDWLISTANMDADCRGWFINLLLHNYDKGSLPNDIEKLAVLCNVRFSEFERFKQVFEQVLKQKFELTESGELTNLRTSSILKSRETFKEKRANSGKIGYLTRFIKQNYPNEFKNKELLKFIFEKINFNKIDLKDKNILKHLLNQMLKQFNKLYENENENENIDKIKNENIVNNWQEEKEKSSAKKEKEFSEAKNILLEHGANEQDIDVWFEYRETKKKSNKSYFAESLVALCNKNDVAVKDAVSACALYEWVNFNPAYLEKPKNQKEDGNTKNIIGRTNVDEEEKYLESRRRARRVQFDSENKKDLRI